MTDAVHRSRDSADLQSAAYAYSCQSNFAPYNIHLVDSLGMCVQLCSIYLIDHERVKFLNISRHV